MVAGEHREWMCICVRKSVSIRTQSSCMQMCACVGACMCCLHAYVPMCARACVGACLCVCVLCMRVRSPNVVLALSSL